MRSLEYPEFKKAVLKEDMIQWIQDLYTVIHQLDKGQYYTAELHEKMIQLIEKEQSDAELVTNLKTIEGELTKIRYALYFADNCPFLVSETMDCWLKLNSTMFRIKWLF